MFCNTWADIIEEPKIVQINDYLLVYKKAAIEQAPSVTGKERFWMYNDDKGNEIGIFNF